jgi:folate-dependent tRNA-U54 methylase TrmFO/GidA
VLFVRPGSLEFNFIIGSTAPKEQKLSVTACHNLPFSAQVTGGANWLTATPAEGILPGSTADRCRRHRSNRENTAARVTISATDT